MCDRRIGPFDCCSVVQGDCLELMKSLPDGCVDAVITDPPYGMNWNPDSKRFSGGMNPERRAKQGKDWPSVIGDNEPFNPLHLLKFERVIIWGFNHFAAYFPVGTTLVWIKKYDEQYGTFLSDAELAWMKGGHGIYCRRDTSMLGETSTRLHPTQKPVGLMEWCIKQMPYWDIAQAILDPYCGSGSTLVAAKKLGRHFLGFEISGEYCQIARDRLARVDAQPNLFEPKAEQLSFTSG